MSERKKSMGLVDTGRRIKDEVLPCKSSTVIFCTVETEEWGGESRE